MLKGLKNLNMAIFWKYFDNLTLKILEVRLLQSLKNEVVFVNQNMKIKGRKCRGQIWVLTLYVPVSY